MKKVTAAIAFIVIAAAGFAEYKLFITKTDKPDDISVSVSDTAYQDSVKDVRSSIVVNTSGGGIKGEYPSISDTDTDYDRISSVLLTNLEKVEKMNACDVRISDSFETQANGCTYYKSVERYFSSTDDVNTYLSLNLTSSLIMERYSGITGGSAPALIDNDGLIYVKNAKNTDSIMEFSKDQDGVITSELVFTAPDSFTVTSGEHTFVIVSDEGLWKISSVE